MLGQPTPLARQIPCPATVAEAKEAKLACKVEAVAFKKEPVPRTERAVEVTLIPVALVKVTPAREEAPVTFNVPATVSVPVTLEEAATNPPKNWAVVVVKLPRAVTDWRVSRPAAEQFVPLARQTAIPFTNIAVAVTVLAETVRALSVEPVALVKESVAIDPEVEVSVVIVPLELVRVLAAMILELRETPVAEEKPNWVAKRLVEVVLVPVAFVKTRLVRENGPVRTRF